MPRISFAPFACLLLLLGQALAGSPKNVILCIGDGMGEGQIAAARCFSGASLSFELFPYRSRMTTANAAGGITDSAAAATAIATGRKVSNQVLSLAVPGDGAELETLLEACQRQGKATGLITTCYLTDATPAAFAAHAANRFADAGAIAWQYLNRTRPDVLLGAGATGLDDQSAAAAGYSVVTDRAALQAAVPADGMKLCGVFGWGYLPYESDGLGTLPSLAEMTAQALTVLERAPQGFFLMLEGGKIDLASHGNDIVRVIGETLGFDAAVRAVLRWAQGREGDTLVLVLADHETGGLNVLGDNGPGNVPEVAWSSGNHTESPVTLYGWGATAHLVPRVRDNTQIRAITLTPAPAPGAGIGIARAVSGQAVTSWSTVSGATYRVECAADLKAPVWQTLATLNALSARMTFVDTNATARGHGFYRLRQP